MPEPIPHLLLLVHAAATWFMAGVIWFVQVVHYPLFVDVGRDQFPGYEHHNTAATSWVVGPPMLVEAATGALLLWSAPAGARPQLWIGLALLVLIWLSTALLQIPRHNELSRGFNTRAHQRLVQTNWLRTAAWTARALLVLSLTW